MRFVPSSQTLKNYEKIIGEVKTVTVPVNRANTTVALTTQTAGDGGAAKVVLSASVGKSLQGDFATGTVTFLASSDGGTYAEIGAASVVNGTAVFAWEGMPQQAYQIQARYSGDQNYNGAYSEQVRVDVGGVMPDEPEKVNGWYMENGERYWYDHGIMARDKEVYDPGTDAWYWFDEDGTMATDKDVFIPTNEARTEGKWVRYDSNGGMVKGEDLRYGGWYWFDPVTGEMIKGFVFIPEEGSAGKWVYYDEIDGQMHHGESCINGGWYYFDEWTGKMTHGEYYRNDAWYYYDQITGIMAHGWVMLPDGTRAYYDEVTGVRK